MKLLPSNVLNKAINSLTAFGSRDVKTLPSIPTQLRRRDAIFRSPDIFANLGQDTRSGQIQSFANIDDAFTTQPQQTNAALDSMMMYCFDLAYGTIKEYVDSVLGAKLIVCKNVDGKKVVVDNHPFLDWLKNPNDTMTDQDLFEALITHFFLTGRPTLLKWREKFNSWSDLALNVSKGGRTVGFLPVRNDQIKKIYDQDRKFTGWEFRQDSRSPKIAVSPDNVATMVNYNPVFANHGFSGFEPLKPYLELDRKILEDDNDVIEKGGYVNVFINQGITHPNGTTLSADGIQQRMKANRDNYLELRKRQGVYANMPVFLADATPTAIPSVKNYFSEDILDRIESRWCFLTKIPPQRLKVGLKYGNTYSNGEEANKQFALRGVLPMMLRIKDFIERSSFFRDWASDGEFLSWDLTDNSTFDFMEKEAEQTKTEKAKQFNLVVASISKAVDSGLLDISEGKRQVALALQ